MSNGKDTNQLRLSVVIPAYNSAAFIEATLVRLKAVMQKIGHPFEIVIVNDGSADSTWDVIVNLCKSDERIIAINLLKNYGQHSAILCGLRHSHGDFVITMDDDLQNPPEEIERMLSLCVQGEHDLVIGEFAEPKKARFRMIGTQIVDKLVNYIFNKDPELKLSTFRVIRRDVVDRVCQSKNPTPYISGELLYASTSAANIVVRHDARRVGKSNYGLIGILKLVRRITFSYSIGLLRLSCRLGACVSAISFLLSIVMAIRGQLINGVVPGWTSIVTTVSFFSGVIILLLSMVGEFLSVVMLQMLGTPAYRETQVVNLEKKF